MAVKVVKHACGWSEATVVNDYTPEEISYIRRVCEDALRAEGRKGVIRIGYAHYHDPDRFVRVVTITGSRAVHGTWHRVDRRVSYRLSRNWGKYFSSPCPRVNGNYVSHVVAEFRGSDE